MMLGNTSQFAIEFEITGSNRGYIRLWINSIPIGLWEETYLLPVLNSLERIKDFSSSHELNLDKRNKTDVFTSILEKEELYNTTLLGFGETFDNFEIRAYIYNGNVVFLWKPFLTIQAETESQHENISIDYGIISYNTYINVIELFKSNLFLTKNS